MSVPLVAIKRRSRQPDVYRTIESTPIGQIANIASGSKCVLQHLRYPEQGDARRHHPKWLPIPLGTKHRGVPAPEGDLNIKVPDLHLHREDDGRDDDEDEESIEIVIQNELASRRPVSASLAVVVSKQPGARRKASSSENRSGATRRGAIMRSTRTPRSQKAEEPEAETHKAEATKKGLKDNRPEENNTKEPWAQALAQRRRNRRLYYWRQQKSSKTNPGQRHRHRRRRSRKQMGLATN